MAVRFANESPQIWENSRSCLINLWLPGFYQGTSGFQESQWTKVRGLKHPINWYWQLQEGGSPQTEQNIKPILNPTNTQTAIKLFMIQMPTSQISQALCSHMYLPLLSASPKTLLFQPTQQSSQESGSEIHMLHMLCLRRSPGEGNGNPLQYSCLENSMNRGYTVHGVTRVGHDLATKPPPY